MRTRRRLAALFAVPFALTFVFFLLTVFSDRTQNRLQEVQNLTLCVAKLQSLSSDLETGAHGFVLTGNEEYLDSLERAHESLPAQVRSCQHAASSVSGEMAAATGKLGRLLSSQAMQASDVLSIVHEQGGTAARSAIDRQRAIAGIAVQVQDGLEDLERKVAEREASVLRKQRNWNRISYLVFFLGTVVLVVVLMRLYKAAVTYLQSRDSLQDELHRLNLSLESEVEQRTLDLRLANEELQQFAYVASHDLQEPLRTITSFTQLLQSRYQGKLDEDADEFIGFIVAASRRMTDLINGLLALARLRKTGQPTAPVAFGDLLEEVESNLAASIQASEAVITHSHLPSLVVDKVQILQLLQNLISNAMKYRTLDVVPQIHVSAARDVTHWVFSVQDNGRGFDQKFSDRIFGMFQRINGAKGVEGTGIGLTIARKITERHGGRIWAKSEEGRGSTFCFSLPVSLEVPRNETSPSPPPGTQLAAKVK